ncbi:MULTISPECIES: flagellar protein FliS [Novosphingobium]|uniref:Flagellar protein FliS n=1 Tax=Novosphingobium decolorationis TaxID=2698673 RepID=A0ABX8E822_9SPHN|nr:MULTISPECIES: flagellar protein FliS [Novosphingobium]MED5544370.1 flagellar protein FliS [Pseudomonadota bacterium]MEE3154262.1 flagellar protein FliS [Pseudomonadota bacterium]QVM85335.1 flagellar protein FliS [Novosphingobium decolorationis]GAM03421.1 flagellin-specific chaperone FliS-like protein [Novosphingobium sp. MBES04]
MLGRVTPHEAYRRVDFDARVNGADRTELVHLCYEHLISALGTALHADAIGDGELKSRSITRALTAVTALQMGVSGDSGIASALNQLYAAARRTILDSATAFARDRIDALRTDFLEIGQAMQTG